MSERNQMIVKGKDTSGDIPLTINLADDNLEVRGFGQPITTNKARQMAESYFSDCESAWNFIEQINNSGDDSLKSHPGFKALQGMINPSSQTVSGVFGKEIILQILAQQNCEGIRYVLGKDEEKNTIILLGVEQVDDEPQLNKGVLMAQSQPLQRKVKGMTLGVDDDPVKGEVHKNSLNILEARTIFARKANLEGLISDVLFGLY